MKNALNAKPRYDVVPASSVAGTPDIHGCVISEVKLTLTNAQCDRSRPNCLACIKRQSVCKFSDIANLIAAGADGYAAVFLNCATCAC